MANTRPAWRAPIKKTDGFSRTPVQTEEFKQKRKLQLGLAPKCTAICKSHGFRCKQLALKGTDKCRYHGGMKKALEAEAERLGKPVFRATRSSPARNRALAMLAITTPWPDGLPHRPDLDDLNAVRRGELFEAWFNRATDPETFKHAMRIRPKIMRRPR
jgi:hypothetical protein